MHLSISRIDRCEEVARQTFRHLRPFSRMRRIQRNAHVCTPGPDVDDDEAAGACHYVWAFRQI